MSKYPVGETVRVTNHRHDKFDQVGTVTDDRAGISWPFRVAFKAGQMGELFRAHELTLADPDVHTVLDQMDAESGSAEKSEPLADWEIELLSGRRSVILRTAEKLINGQRAKDYDTKDDAAGNFTRIGKLWAEILGVPVKPEQVALCMAQVKIARLITSPAHEDSWIDLAGYAALGGEIAAAEAAQ